MSAEGMPPVGSSILSRVLVRITQGVVRYPVVTLIASVVVGALALLLGSTHLSYHTSRSALINHKSDYQRRWLSYVEEFSDKQDVVVVVEGENREAIIPVLDELVAEVGRHPKFFQGALHEIDLAKVRSKGLHYLPMPELQSIDRFVEEMEPVTRGGWALLTPGAMAAGMVARVQDLPPEKQVDAQGELQERMVQLADSLLASLCRADGYRSPWPDMATSGSPLNETSSNRLVTDDGRFGFVLLKLADAEESRDFVAHGRSLGALRQIVAQARVRHPQLEIGLTGLPVMESDEMQCSQSSMSLATILSLGGVVLVLVAGLGGLRHPLLAMVALVAGMVWSLGYTTLAVGHLNILSSAFGAILIGLGINYGTYFIARYLQLRQDHHTTDEALVSTAGSVGPGIAIGAATTAIAFFMASFTEFTGVAELGVIAGGGIILCWLASTTLLPAIVHLSDSTRSNLPLPSPLSFDRWIDSLVAHPRLVLGLTVGCTFVVALGIFGIRYDYNLLNLQPVGLESVELERKLLTETKESAWYAVSVASTPQEVAARKERFLRLPSVERVEEIASRIPASSDQKRAIIERLHGRLNSLPDRAPSIPVSTPTELGQMLTVAQGFMSATPQASAFQEKLEQIGGFLGRLAPTDYYSRLSDYQQQMAEDLLARLRMLQAASTPEPPKLSDLPESLVSRFVGKQGKHLMKIYSKHDIWNMEAMEQFVAQVRSVDAEATGNPLQVYEASRQMKRSFEQATYLAAAGILPVVFMTCGSLRSTLLALLPLILGTLQTFGLMGLLGITRNPANMIALPLMLGMGVDNGIHIVHDYLRQRGRYRMSGSTGAAVVLNTLTTMVGFAVLMLADHRGLQSLGRVLTLGMGCCMFSSLVALPTLLSWLTNRRETTDEVATERLDESSPSEERLTEVGLMHGTHYRVDSAHPVAAPARPASQRVLRHYLDLTEE